MTQQEARRILDQKWECRKLKLDWLTYEQFVRDIMESPTILDPHVKLAFLAEALGAWTGRGTPQLTEE